MRRVTFTRAVMAGAVPGLLVPAAAKADSQVRFAHALPGVGRGELDVKAAGQRARRVASASFAHVTRYAPVTSGAVTLSLSSGGKTVSSTKARLADGRRYTVVALGPAKRIELHVYTDGGARAGAARVRVIHAAPELGSPNVEFDGKVVAPHFGFGKATTYLTVSPGQHSFAAKAPGQNMPLLSVKAARLAAGTSYTAFVMGTRGEPVRAVLAVDARAHASRTPRRGRAVLVIREGQSLWSIAAARLGAVATDARIWAEVVRLWNLNKDRLRSGNPDLIYPGERLHLA